MEKTNQIIALYAHGSVLQLGKTKKKPTQQIQNKNKTATTTNNNTQQTTSRLGAEEMRVTSWVLQCLCCVCRAGFAGCYSVSVVFVGRGSLGVTVLVLCL